MVSSPFYEWGNQRRERLGHLHTAVWWEILVLGFKSKCGHSLNNIRMLLEFVKDEALGWMLLGLKQGRSPRDSRSFPVLCDGETKVQNVDFHGVFCSVIRSLPLCALKEVGSTSLPLLLLSQTWCSGEKNYPLCMHLEQTHKEIS